MSSDRWGYFDHAGYHYWPAIVTAGDFYGFRQDDPIYKERRPYEKGQERCPSCRLHAASDRNYPCDVYLARAADIEAAGYPATFCSRCSIAMPVRSGQATPRCWYCDKPPKRYKPRVRNGLAYIPDGHGCVVAVPSHHLRAEGY